MSHSPASVSAPRPLAASSSRARGFAPTRIRQDTFLRRLRRDRTALAGMAIVGAFVVLAIGAPVIA
ncbi:MAG: hypothetical protein M3457_19800, partial [Chloroflexota bacterium]|nr:hypothetical protein [Chloroflexota bacterium]